MTCTAIGLYSILNSISTARTACHSQRRLRTTTICLPVAVLTPPYAPIPSYASILFTCLSSVVLVLFLDISCAYDSLLTPWRMTHRRPLTHFV
jgi:hypothetical protein